MTFIWNARDEERRATTDGRGRYELHGVDPEHGVWASHPDYGGTDDAMKKPGEPLFDVYLKPRDNLTLRGRSATRTVGPWKGSRWPTNCRWKVMRGMPRAPPGSPAPTGTGRTR